MQLKPGARVRVARSIDLEPYTTLKVGERGEVVSADEDGPGGPSVTIKLERRHEGLKNWNNTAYLVEPELSRIEPIKKAWAVAKEFVLAGIGSVALVGLVKAHAVQILWGVATTVLTTIDFL